VSSTRKMQGLENYVVPVHCDDIHSSFSRERCKINNRYCIMGDMHLNASDDRSGYQKRED
jgi:hypothetical protein